MFSDEVFQMDQILSPVVVRIGDIFIAIKMAASDGVEIGKVAWVTPDWNSNDSERDETQEDGEYFLGPGFVLGAFVEIKERFGDEHIEEGHDRKEMAEADIEIASDTDVTVKEDKEQSEILSHTVLERMTERFHETVFGLFFNQRFDDTVESIA